MVRCKYFMPVKRWCRKGNPIEFRRHCYCNKRCFDYFPMKRKSQLVKAKAWLNIYYEGESLQTDVVVADKRPALYFNPCFILIDKKYLK